MKTKLLLVMISSSAALGCNKATKTEAYSYEYNYNGCATGKHSFNSTAELCDGLKNESLNNFCAFEARRKKYEQNCSK